MKQRICTILGVIVALAALGIVFEAAGIRVRAQSPNQTRMAVDIAHLQSDVAMLKDAVKETNAALRDATAQLQQSAGSSRMLTIVVGILVTLIAAVIAARLWQKPQAQHLCAECGKRREP